MVASVAGRIRTSTSVSPSSLSSSVSDTSIHRDRRPELALRAAPFDARANANRAAALIERQQGRPVVREAGDQARLALVRDPTAVIAVRTLALLAALTKNEPKAEQLFNYSAMLSRRDLPTQLWLIEEKVKAGDIDGALRQYDVALRTSHTRGARLFPIMIAASADPVIAARLNVLLREKPNWWRAFVVQFVTEAKRPESILAVTRGLLSRAVPEERDIIAAALRRLVDQRRYDLAWQMYGAGSPAGQTGFVRNGEFEQEGHYPPIDWALVDEPDFSARREPHEAGRGFVLALNAGSGRGGRAAVQLLRLPPGNYALTAEVGNVGADVSARPYVTLTCASDGKRQLTRIDFPEAGDGGSPVKGRFSIRPGECGDQLLGINVQAQMGPSDIASWIDSLRITKV